MFTDSLSYIAGAAVAKARKRGEIVAQPCVVCGGDKTVAHHESYHRPLDVTWLCRTHHRLRHSELNLALFGRRRTGIPYVWVFEYGVEECRRIIARQDRRAAVQPSRATATQAGAALADARAGGEA